MTAHARADEKLNPLRVLIDLQQTPEAQHREAPISGLDPNLASLRVWQSNRLKHTYADLLTDQRSAPA